MPGNLAATAMAWFCVMRHGIDRAVVQVFFDVTAALTTFFLIKNSMDILWFGHDAVLDQPRESALLMYSSVLVWSAWAMLGICGFAWLLTAERTQTPD